ncbi:MAG TPA: sulfite exporter TauE/SafE family protein, partial [Sphingomonadaceae bacterium]
MDHIIYYYSLAGAFVGFLVGLTGVGGGSLMAPVLILLFGFNPAVAVGTDLWFACLTKTVGGVVHHHLGSPDWKIVGRLAAGSLPAAIVTLLWLGKYHHGHLQSDVLMELLGAALL